MEGQQYFNLDEVAWREFGGSTRGVFVKALATKASTEKFNLSLFRVEPDAEFPRHKPSHAHVLHFLRGRGECWVGSRSYQAKPGMWRWFQRKKSIVTEARERRTYYF